MTDSWEQFGLSVLSGRRKGLAASLLRTGLLPIEPLYAGAMLLRNFLYSQNLKPAHTLPRPVVSIGNITTGGTGKTPLVRWLADRLRHLGHHPAILLRGYKRNHASLSDEQTMLDRLLNADHPAKVIVHADPDRLRAAQAVLTDYPQTDVFLLDDAFQHRRIRRDFDLVLINAAEPFGFNHVIPRGLLREPLVGLRRADAFLLTHASEISPQALQSIETELRRRNPDAAIYHADHIHTTLQTPDSSRPLDDLRRTRFFAFCGIGNPQALHHRLQCFAPQYAGHRWFPDHHSYTPQDLLDLRLAARSAGADILLTTEKDWVKLAALPDAADPALPLWRLDLALRFHGSDEDRLFHQIISHLNPPGSPSR